MNKLPRVITFSGLLLSAGISASVLAAPVAPALPKATEIRSAIASTAADYYGTYYLWWEDGFYAKARNTGRIELRADGGSFTSDSYTAPFSWQLSENGLLTLNFNNFVEATSFRAKTGVGTVETHHVMTQITLQRTFTEADDSQQMNFVFSKSGYYKYLTGGLPDEPYPAGSGTVQSTRQAGLLKPAQLIQSNTTVAIPAWDYASIAYPPEVSSSVHQYLRQAHKLHFGEVQGEQGTATIEKVLANTDGSFSTVSEPLSWQINPDRTVTLRESDGDEHEMAFLDLSQAGLPVMQLRSASNNLSASTIAGWPFFVEKQLVFSPSQLAATPVLHFNQTPEAPFWFELRPKGVGLQVNATDSNQDHQYSDSEISQQPIRWQLNNGILEIRRYRYSPAAGKSGYCLPNTFAPAATDQCITEFIRTLDVLAITDHNGTNTATVFNVMRQLNTNRKANWPSTDILQTMVSIDTRSYQLKTERPVPIKPLVAGIAIADDGLRQCLLESNPTMPADLTDLFCGHDIRNLQEIEQFPNLRRVHLYGSSRLSITGLSALKKLPHLQELTLSNMQAGDTEFASLQGLQLVSQMGAPTTLALHGIGITDASFAVLDSMNFTALDLTGPLTTMPITRLPNEQTLQRLTLLALTDLPLPNIKTELARLSNLPMTILSLRDMKLGSLQDIKLPPNLYQLIVANDSLSDLSAAQLNPATLVTLHLSANNLPSIDFISGLPKLRNLKLDTVTLKNWSPLVQPLPLKNLSAYGNLHVPCSVFQAIAAANPTMVIQYDACSSSEKHSYELKLTNGVSALGVSFADPANSAKGLLSLSNGQLTFVPAAGVTGWVEFYVRVQLSNGSSKTILFRTFVQNPNAAQKGLPWWILTAPTT